MHKEPPLHFSILLYICTMHRKIYFGNKPLFLAGEKTAEMEPYLRDENTIFADQLNEDTVTDVISRIQQPQTLAGIFIHRPFEELWSAVEKKFTVIRAAGGLVHSGRDEILLIFRRGKWDLPKGKLDEGEELEACAVREVEEETGLQQISLQKPLCITYHTYYQGTAHILKESHWYLMRTENSQVLTPQTEEDIEKCEWVKPANMAPYMDNAFPNIIDVVKEAVNTFHKIKEV